jgi:hypothetical protein
MPVTLAQSIVIFGSETWGTFEPELGEHGIYQWSITDLVTANSSIG